MEIITDNSPTGQSPNMDSPGAEITLTTMNTEGVPAGNGLIQSPYIALLAAGSGATDSSTPIASSDGSIPGIHLRWLLNGCLGKNHMPKGNLSNSTHNFNKPEDVVKIWRTPYIRNAKVLNIETQSPLIINHQERTWIYTIDREKQAKLIFHNGYRYEKLTQDKSLSTDNDPFGFIQAYGNNLFEIEIIGEECTFFGTKINTKDSDSNWHVEIETLSEQYILPEELPQENILTEDADLHQSATLIFNKKKVVSSRKKFKNSQNNINLRCENGRSIRYRKNKTTIYAIEFEFYRDTFDKANEKNAWTKIGNEDFSLSTDDNTVHSRLEYPDKTSIERWPRFIKNTNVITDDYKERWNSQEDDYDIKHSVLEYISRSEDETNPRGIIEYHSNSSSEGDENTAETVQTLAMLDLLNFGACDFHVARMLGLATIDDNEAVISDVEKEYMYLMEYYTLGNLDGTGTKEVHHLSFTLPTAVKDERLPSAVKVEKVVAGIESEEVNEVKSDTTYYRESQGYTKNKRFRFVSLIAEKDIEFIEQSFFKNDKEEFEGHTFSLPVFAGVLHRMNSETEWRTPELSHLIHRKNNKNYYETIPLIVSENKRIIYIHRQEETGTHYYKSYGINIFSRSNKIDWNDTPDASIVTSLNKDNIMNPPSTIMAHLIREENPIVLTTSKEQESLSEITNTDKTFIRLTFNHHCYQDMYSYRVDAKYDHLSDEDIINDLTIYPNEEPHADKAQVFFRNFLPRQISGKIIEVKEHPNNMLLSIIRTGEYALNSIDSVLTPNLSADVALCFEKGIFLLGEDQYIVESINTSSVYPEITVFKKEISNLVLAGDDLNTKMIYKDHLQSPDKNINDGLFVMIENMQNMNSWSSSNPVFEIPLSYYNLDNWKLNREILSRTAEDGSIVRFIEKSRGFWATAMVSSLDTDNNLYSVTFNNFNLQKHPLTNSSIDWYKGQVRVLTTKGNRWSFDVIAVTDDSNNNNGGNDERNLVLVFQSTEQAQELPNPESATIVKEDILLDEIQEVNYYPGYKVYLYANEAKGLTEKTILPIGNTEISHCIFGLRTYCDKSPDNNIVHNQYSKISVPAVMYAQKIEPPRKPKKPTLASYTTRPDSYGKSSFSITTEFEHLPHSALYYRSNEQLILNALYKKETIYIIQNQLESLGGVDEKYAADRWKEFILFKDPNGVSIEKFTAFPLDEENEKYALPIPDHFNIIKDEEYNGLNLNSIIEGKSIKERIKEEIYKTFIPLTEFPLVFSFIKGVDYEPIPKKQKIRDRNGELLDPYSESSEFDMAPMAKKVNEKKILFTDFTIDSGSKNLYFYCVREMNSQMQMGDFSEMVGPVKVVNTTPIKSPEIRNVIPTLKNEILSEEPNIQFEINTYPKEYKIRKITLYRTNDFKEAQSTRNMQKITSVYLDEADIKDASYWEIADNFEGEVPYGDTLYYRITVSREIEYKLKNEDNIHIDYAPSMPSKIIASMITDTTRPKSPLLEISSDEETENNPTLYNVTFSWNKTAYNATYYLYKMNPNGNWGKIYQIKSNDERISINLSQTTLPNSNELSDGTLNKQNEAGNEIYHHFKVIAQNTGNMFSVEENILTI